MRAFWLLLIVPLLFNCDNQNHYQQDLLPDAQGGVTEITIVVDKKLWENHISESFENALRPQIKGVFSKEYTFDLINVDPQAFTRLFKVQRFILLVVINSKIDQPKLGFKEDVYAKGQTYIQFEVPSVGSAKDFIAQEGPNIVGLLKEKGIKKLQGDLFKYRNKKVTDQLRKNHNLEAVIPIGYRIIKDTTGFVYLTKQDKALCEYGQSTNCYYQNGIMISYETYTSDSIFNAATMEAKRNARTQKYVEGASETERAYMEIEPTFPTLHQKINLHGSFGYEMRGWWNMVNATMGGPFVSYTFIDETHNRIITAEGFTFAPKFSKRAFVNELEAICKTVRPL